MIKKPIIPTKAEDIILGSKVEDTITGLVGIAVSRSYWLNGCVQIAIQPKSKTGLSIEDARYIDWDNIVILELKKQPVKVIKNDESGSIKPPGGPNKTISRNGRIQ